MSCIGVTTEPCVGALTGRVLTEVTQVLPGRACVSFSFSGYGETLEVGDDRPRATEHRNRMAL